MADQRTQLATFPLNLGMDNVSCEEDVQPVGPRPRLVRSRNTRLSKVPGMVSKAPGCTQLASGLTGPCGGIVPSGKFDSSIAFFNPPTGSRRVSGAQTGLSQALYDPTQPKSSFFPAQVTDAGGIPGASRTFFNAASCYVESTGQTWFATLVSRGTGSCGVVVTVIDNDGREVLAPVIASPTMATDATSASNFLGLSSHGTTVVLWRGTPALGILATKLSISASLTLSNSGWTTIYTPVATTAYAITQLAYDKRDTASVYLVCQNNAVASSLEIMRVTVPTLAVAATVTIAGVPAESVGIAYLQGRAVLLAIAFGTARNSRELNPTTLATVAAGLTIGAGTSIASCGFQTFWSDATIYSVFAYSESSIGPDGTLVELRAPTTVTLVLTAQIRHQTMVGQIVTQRNSDTDIHALVTTQASYSPGVNTQNYVPTYGRFLSDPSVEVLRLHLGSNQAGTPTVFFYPVARLGTDLAIRYPGSLISSDKVFISSSCSVVADGSRVLVTYLAENTEEGILLSGYLARYAWLDFGNVQPRYAITGEGAAVIAGAMPTVWDGNQVTEYGPIRVPMIIGSTAAGGAGPLLTAGDYLFAVVVSWKDALGQIHRSPPSNVVTVTAATNPTVTACSPVTSLNGGTQELYQMALYASEPGGIIPYAQNALSSSGSYGSTGDTWPFTFIPQPVADAFHPAIYTDGSATQPLAAYCPNACIDAAVIADRVWLLDAERPNRWWYSKPKESGYFFEMAPDLFIDVPSTAGKGIATAHVNDSPMFLCSKGIWTVAGEGPDALLNPPEFSAPQQVSDVPCTQRNSVLKTPVGVMFVSNNRFVLFNGPVKTFDDINATLHGNVIGTALFREQQEAVFFLADGYCYVYNWIKDAFTDWSPLVTGITSCTAVAQVPASGKVLIYGDNGELWLMDPSTVSTTAQIDLQTGFVTLGGVQDDQVVANLIVHAKRAGSHGVTVTMSTDYRGTLDATKTYAAADVLGAVDDTATSKRYDLFPEPSQQQARAIQIGLTETDATGEAFQPVSCTIEVRKNGGKLMKAMRTTARK